MLRPVKHNLMRFASPVDPRTIVLFIACATAFYLGVRFEAVSTAEVKKEFAEYKLTQAEALSKAQQETLNEAVAAQAAIQEINENANAREAELSVANSRLAARLRDERMRREALAKQVSKAGYAASSGECPAGSSGPDLYGKAGEDIVSLIREADAVLSALRDCKAYVEVIQKGGSSQAEP